MPLVGNAAVCFPKGPDLVAQRSHHVIVADSTGLDLDRGSEVQLWELKRGRQHWAG